MAYAVEIIGKRAKALQRKNPNANWKTLQKQAGKEYKAGKLGKGTKSTGKHKRKKGRVHGPGRGIDNPIVGAMGTGIDNAVVGRVKRKKGRRMHGPGTGIDNAVVGRASRHSGVTVSHLKSAIKDKLLLELAAAEGRKYAATKAGPHNKAVKRQ
jgi:hypothetical protein